MQITVSGKEGSYSCFISSQDVINLKETLTKDQRPILELHKAIFLNKENGFKKSLFCVINSPKQLIGSWIEKNSLCYYYGYDTDKPIILPTELFYGILGLSKYTITQIIKQDFNKLF